MKQYRVYFILISIILLKVIADAAFKIHYYEAEVYQIQNFKLDDTKEIVSGEIIVGKSMKGRLEATIFPEEGIIVDSESQIESKYIYLRFHPDWFEKNIKPCISNYEKNNYKELRKNTKEIHEQHFRRYAHFNRSKKIRNSQILPIKEFGSNSQFYYISLFLI